MDQMRMSSEAATWPRARVWLWAAKSAALEVALGITWMVCLAGVLSQFDGAWVPAVYLVGAFGGVIALTRGLRRWGPYARRRSRA